MNRSLQHSLAVLGHASIIAQTIVRGGSKAEMAVRMWRAGIGPRAYDRVLNALYGMPKDEP